jgi:hemolysin activation/secretion protein
MIEELKLYSFLDFGIAKDYKKSFENNKQALLGSGLGLKYNLDNKINLKFDWGIPLFKIPGKNNQQLYLSVISSF